MGNTAIEQVVIRVGGENDGPGYIIYVGSDGKLHIKKVPGWDPGVRLQFDAAVSILQHAALAKDAKIEQKLIASAEKLMNPIAQQVYKSVQAQ